MLGRGVLSLRLAGALGRGALTLSLAGALTRGVLSLLLAGVLSLAALSTWLAAALGFGASSLLLAVLLAVLLARGVVSLLLAVLLARGVVSPSAVDALGCGVLSPSVVDALSVERAVVFAFVVEVERRVRGAASGVVVSPVLAGLLATSASAVDAVLTFSAEACARVVELLRRDVAGFVSCSWLTAVALSVFGRVVRLREVAGFACSLDSEDSDVFVMKKTPPLHTGTPHHLNHWFAARL